MADPRFYDRVGPFRLGDLAGRLGATFGAEVDPARLVSDVASLADAGPGDLGFYDDVRYRSQFAASRVEFCLVADAAVAALQPAVVLLIAATPQPAFAAAARLFYPEIEGPPPPAAGVAATAAIGANVLIGGGAVIGPGAVLGPGVVIEPMAVVGRGVAIGAESRIGAAAVVGHAILGERVVIKPGARIGQAGFGFVESGQGLAKVPQLGRVVIEDDVEIGANTTIDRGAIGDTVIGAGTKIDNQVQIGHNVRIGRGCIIVAQVGISGSTQLDDQVMIGGQAGLGGHLKIGKGARVAAKSGIFRDVEPGADVGGFPAVPIRDWHRQSVALARLGKRKGNSDGR